MLSLILLVFAFVLFAIAGWAYGQPENPRLGWGRLLAWGLAFYVLAVLVERGAGLLH